MITTPLLPSFWRAPTDNDFGNKMPERCEIWKTVMDNVFVEAVNAEIVSAEEIKINTKLKLPAVEGSIRLEYTLYGNGKIGVNYTFEARKADLPEIPRIGMVFNIPMILII